MPVVAEELFSERNRLDPYPLYSELRESGDGIHFVEAANAWMVMRYEDVATTIKDRARLSSDLMASTMGFGAHDPGDPVHQRYARVAAHNLAVSDPPVHTRLRGLVGHAFTSHAIAQWTSAVQATTDEVLGTLPDGVEIDAVGSLAEVLPVLVIAKLLGVPIADRERFRRLSVAFTETFDPTITGERRDRSVRDSVELFDYVEALAEDRTGNLGEDLLSLLIKAEEEGSRLSREELVATVCMLLVAGNETTADTIASGLALLLAHPDQLDALRHGRATADDAVLEVLRYESPLQFTARVATTDMPLGEHEVRQSQLVYPCMASANRDPRQYERSDTFDIGRADARHLAFGLGPHFCVGNQLARLEAATFFRTVIAGFEIRPGAEPGTLRMDRFFQRGYQTLPVTFTARRPQATQRW